MHYILLDEVQNVPEFTDVLNSYLSVPNADVYVTGSNSKFLSKDVITEFRGRGDEIHVWPLSLAEIHEAKPEKSWQELWEDYIIYGGLPLAVLKPEEEKSEYLKRLFKTTYLKDIKERNTLRNDHAMDLLLNVLSSTVGSLTNPQTIANTFASEHKTKFDTKTIKQYLEYLEEAYLIAKAERFNVLGRKYISTPYKYYFEDIGLRNARLNFRQLDYGHVMENIVFNELCRRGFNVDVGVVEIRKNSSSRLQTEIDFVCNKGNQRYYIQSAYSLPTTEKEEQEFRPLRHIPDSFKKIVLVHEDIRLRRDNSGIVTMGMQQFMLNEHSLDL